MRNLVFKKHPSNPLLTAEAFPAEVMYVFNPGAVRFNNEYLLLCDAALGSTRIVMWMARSKDGINFTPDPAPVAWPADTPAESCIYDPRITKFGDEYILMYASHHLATVNPQIGIVKTRDFVNFERIPQAKTDYANRNGVLFPEKIGGRYVRFDRPMPNGETGTAGMCIAYSDDLSVWYDRKELMQPNSFGWDSHKIGGAAVPIRTPEGWLVIYHGVDAYSCNNYIYRLGVMLLDLDNPAKILSRCQLPVLWPDQPYEFIGRTPNVVFSCGALLEGDDKLRLYYGAADSCIALAEASLSELVKFCRDYADRDLKI